MERVGVCRCLGGPTIARAKLSMLVLDRWISALTHVGLFPGCSRRATSETPQRKLRARNHTFFPSFGFETWTNDALLCGEPHQTSPGPLQQRCEIVVAEAD